MDLGASKISNEDNRALEEWHFPLLVWPAQGLVFPFWVRLQREAPAGRTRSQPSVVEGRGVRQDATDVGNGDQLLSVGHAFSDWSQLRIA